MGMRCLMAISSQGRPRGMHVLRAPWIPALALVLAGSACTQYRVVPHDGGDAVAPDGASLGGAGGSSGSGGAGVGGAHDAGGTETLPDAPIDTPAGTGGAIGTGGMNGALGGTTGSGGSDGGT